MTNIIVSPIRRLGRKNKILDKLLMYFPKNINIFLEPFCGSGAVGLNVAAKHKFLNDVDDNIFDAFTVFSDQEMKKRLLRYFMQIPYSDKVFAYFRIMQPKNIIQKVAKFLILSGWGYMGKPETLSISQGCSKTQIMKQINKIYIHLCKDNIKWTSKDFGDFLKSVSIRDEADYKNAFIYCDSPYLFTTNNYSTAQHSTKLSWGVDDFKNVVESCVNFGCNFAISEFDNETVRQVAKEYGLYVTPIVKRRNMKNERVEILITNYDISAIGKQENLF